MNTKVYSKRINDFLNKHEQDMSSEMATATQNMWRWIKDFSSRGSVEDIKTNIKRGINLLIMFVDVYVKENERVKAMLIDCSNSLLRGKNTCTVQRKNELKRLVEDYNIFTRDVIGCADATNDFMLSLFKSLSSKLGNVDYVKYTEQLSNMCIHLRTEALRN